MKHPVFKATVSEWAAAEFRRAVARVMAMPDEQLAAFNSDETDFSNIGCPNCTGGTQQGQLVWTIDDPDRVKCRYCAMIFPNEKYPMDKVEEVVNPVGVMQRYPYYLGPNTFKYFFKCKVLNGRRQWL
ncbi:MAG: hypothetical protein FJ272_22380, partial [Planctomycetes bacterium]|nr:hypothetical protein [Planctomycetota bacterium]